MLCEEERGDLRKYSIIILIWALSITLPVWAQAQKGPLPAKEIQSQKADDSYIIGPGDILDISQWRDDALIRQVVVLADGRISFPLVGEIMAAGKTVAQIKKDIADKLVEYIPEPVISVEVKQANSMFIYITGKVNNPNRFPVNSNINVLQGLAMAGGLNPFAKQNSIKIFRQEGDKTRVFLFKYDDVVDGKSLDQNITLKRGDVIVVP
jgi:polysaccharide biosynthesis/export protein